MDYPEPLRLMDSLDTEISRRSMRSTTVRVLNYVPSSVIPSAQLAPTGTIGIYVARKGSSVLEEIRNAVADSKKGRDRKLARRLIREQQVRTTTTLEDAVRRALPQPVIAHLNYAGSTMCRYIFTERESDLFFTILPWAGGALVDNGFRLDEFVYDEDDSLECVLVANPPHLSAAEKAAIKSVPAEMAHAFVAPADLAMAPTLTVGLAAHVVVWGFVYATYTYAKGVDDTSLEHINPAAIASLGPMATVRAMLKLRLDILKGKTN